MSRHIVTNFTKLATTALRRDALAVLEAGLRAIDTKQTIKTACRLSGSKLTINGQTWDLDAFDHVYVIGIGKASLNAAAALEQLLGNRITDGIVLDVTAAKLKRIKSIAGTHPFPSLANMRATGEIMGILKHVESHDLVITIVSGGGSALLCWPYELKCDQLILLTKALMASGASIHEINTVRKHLSEIQGGQFARLAYPATVVGLIFSDVPGDDLDVIASGPTVMDTTTVEDARAVMKKYDLLRVCRLPDCELRETPKDPVFFQKVSNILMMTNTVALSAMGVEARRRGYAVRTYSKIVSGEAREIGRLLAGLPQPGEMVLAAGETTVTIKGKGKGGRNQEVALGALAHVSDDGLVLSCASDGVDNTPVAGAIADAITKRTAARKRLDSKQSLDNNDSFPFFKAAASHIVTGVTGTNVSDVMISARSR